jgi:hypothetical protein
MSTDPPKETTPHKAAFSFQDCHEDTLTPLCTHFKAEHLSECTNTSLFDYPVIRILYEFAFIIRVIFR